MRSPDEPSADGPRNLLNAVRVASAPEARGVGAVVAMNDEIDAALLVRKLDTGLVSASAPRGTRRSAGSSRTKVELSFVPPRGFTIDPPCELAHAVPLVSVYPGMDGAVIEAVIDTTDAAGLVVEGTGSGNVPGTAVDGISSALERGLPVVLATRVLGGATRSGYGSPGGGAALRELGGDRCRRAVCREGAPAPHGSALQRPLRRSRRARVSGLPSQHSANPPRGPIRSALARLVASVPDTETATPPRAVEGSDGLLLEIDGKIVPNYAATLVDFDEGDVVPGKVVQIDRDEVLVDIGYKSEGVIPINELSIRKSVDPHDEV